MPGRSSSVIFPSTIFTPSNRSLHYTRGGLGDMKVKKFLAAIMQEELTPIRERRKEFENHINDRTVRTVGDLQRMTDKVLSIDGVYPNGRAASYTFVE